MISNKKLNSVVTQLFIRCRKLNMSMLNHKIDLVIKTGEVIDNCMADVYNIVDVTNKNHNNE